MIASGLCDRSEQLLQLLYRTKHKSSSSNTYVLQCIRYEYIVNEHIVMNTLL